MFIGNLNMFSFFKNDYLWSLFWLSLLVLIFFLPVVLGLQSLTEAIPTAYDGYSAPSPQIKTPWTNDGATHTRFTVPVVMSAIEMIKGGIPPLWMPYSGGGGEVMAGSTGSGLYYPLRLVFFLVWNNIHAFDWYFLLRFLIAGFGVFLYLKEIGLGKKSALWGAIAYMFSGYFFMYLTYTFLDIDAILPYVLWSIEKYFRAANGGARMANVFLISLFVGLTILGEQPQSTIIAGILWGGYFLWRTFSAKELFGRWKKHFFALILILILSTLIALPFLIDIFINYQQGFTINDFNDRGTLTFPPVYLLHLLVPPAMQLESAMGGHIYDQGYALIPYFGISVLILFLLSVWIKNKPKFLYFFYIFIAFAMLKNAGFFLINWIGALPILKLVGWHKAYGPMGLAMSILGVYTLSVIASSHSRHSESDPTLDKESGNRQRDASRAQHDGDKKVNWRGFFWTVAAIPIIFLTAYLIAPKAFLKSYVPHLDFFQRRPETIQSVTNILNKFPHWLQKTAVAFIQSNGAYVPLIIFFEAAFFAGLTILLIYLLQKSNRKNIILIIILILTTFEMWLYMPKIRDGFRYFNPYEKTPPYIEFLQKKMADGGISRTFATDYTFMVYASELYKVQRSQSFSAIKPKRYIYLLPDLMLNNDFYNARTEQFTITPRRFFDASNIKYIISQKPLIAPDLKLIYNKDVEVYENLTVLPKTYIVFQKETASSPQNAREKFYDPKFNWQKSVVVEDDNSIGLISPIRPVGPIAQITDYQPNQVIISTDSTQDGILVLTETFYPGWRAYIDNQETEIYPANILFRAIKIPAGKHQVIFKFQPAWFWPSIAISLTAFLLSLFFIIIKRSKMWTS